ncbi:MAG: DUF1385 domain-containing protein [Armatimonadota bacterium]
MTNRSAYGGQAVIEGVMIRGKERVATACRLKDGSITVRHDIADGLTQRYPLLRLAFVRGLPALIDSLGLGYKTLLWSADLAMEGEGEEVKKPTPLAYFFTILTSMVIAIGIFVLLPTALADFVFPKEQHQAVGNIWTQFIPTIPTFKTNIVEGLLRLAFLVVYIMAIGRNAELRRVFAYHGAEHKVVNAYEEGAELTVEGARPYSRIHPRCGTSFLFLFFVIGILIHALIGWPEATWLRMLTRIVLIIPIAGISYEMIRLAGRWRNSRLLRAMVSPGLLLQRLTTAEPTDDQIEVALGSMRAVLTAEGVLQPEPKSEAVTPDTIAEDESATPAIA